MKAPTTSLIYALLCLSLKLESASAIFGFSFSNLLFALNICELPGPGICRANCDPGPLPPGPKDFCDNSCGTTQATRRLGGSTISWTEAACSSFRSDSEAYSRCMTLAVTDCAETSTDADLTYTAYDATSYNGTSSFVGGTTTNGITTTIVSRASFLPYMLAASVSAMFLILYAWKKKVSSRYVRCPCMCWTFNRILSHFNDSSIVPFYPNFSKRKKNFSEKISWETTTATRASMVPLPDASDVRNLLRFLAVFLLSSKWKDRVYLA